MSSSNTKIEIRPLSSCSFDDAVRIWNEGFEGYFVDLTLSLDDYLSRLHNEGLSPAHSLVAFWDGKPAGFLLNGIRMSSGRKAAWNGGTGVSPEFRGRGVGKALMRATIDLYDEHGVEWATLEAISANEKAIALYRQFGYDIIDRLIFLRHDGRLENEMFCPSDNEAYLVKQVAPYEVSKLDFYDQLAPWQAQWQSASRNDGEALIVSDANGVSAGYALYKKRYSEQGKLESILLYQCVAMPGSAAAETIVGCALSYLYAPLELECLRSTYNLSKSNEVVQLMLVDAGFTPFAEQVHMARIGNATC
jgi:ribosomal protein S18 acetylase RimI-like enzyme